MTTSAESLGWSEPEAASAQIGLLYEAHGPMVVGLCRFLLRDRMEAEDAAQQAFVAAHRSLLSGSIPRDAPAWLATIARNECRARIKQRMREPLPLNEPDGAEGHLPDPFHTAVENADLEALRSGLEALPTAQRSAFVLREFAGLSYNELARALEVTEPAVESLLVRARRRLRLALAQANSLAIPVVLRDQLGRLTAIGDDGSVSGVAKIASLPFAAKLAAAGTGAVLAVAGSAGVARLGDPHRETVARPVRAVRAAPRTAVTHPRAMRLVVPVAARREHVQATDSHGGKTRRDFGFQHSTGGPSGSSLDTSGDGGDEGSSIPVARGGPSSGEEPFNGAAAPVTSDAPSTPNGSSGDAAAGAQITVVQPEASTSGPGEGVASESGGDLGSSDPQVSDHGSDPAGDSSSGGGGSGDGSETSEAEQP